MYYTDYHLGNSMKSKSKSPISSFVLSNLCALILSTSALLTHTAWAQIAVKGTGPQLIEGYYPYMASVGAELLTSVVRDDKIDNYPWVLNDDNTKGPTVGSIAYIPDIFCSVKRSDIDAAKADPSIGQFFNNFNLIDQDNDICDNNPLTGVAVKWYMLDDVENWNDNLTWEALNPVEIPSEYVIRTGSDAAKRLQQKHTFPPLISQPLSLNTLDAVEIPAAALGKRIGFILVPQTKTGNPREGMPVKVWDLNKYFAQNPPSKVGNITEENVGFILGNNPTKDPDGKDIGTAGGVVKLGHPPYVRSITAHYATEGELGFPVNSTAAQSYSVSILGGPKGAGGLPSITPEARAVAYIPDAFCEYRNEDIQTDEQLLALETLIGFPKPTFKGFNLPGNKGKLKYFRPYFWIADADEDSCDIESNQITWSIVEPKDPAIESLKADIKAAIQEGSFNNRTGEFEKRSYDIWSKVKSWDDVQPVSSLVPEIIEPVADRTGLYNFDGVGGRFISAMRMPDAQSSIVYVARPAFIFTPKTKAGLPDTGRQIKAPYVGSTLWGQLPPKQAQSLEDAKPDSQWMSENGSTSGILIGAYPQIMALNSKGGLDLITLDELKNINNIDYACLLDPNKVPAQDCVSPLPVLNPPLNLSRSVGATYSPKTIEQLQQYPVGIPVIENLTLKGFVGVGEVLEVNYDFVATKGVTDPVRIMNQSVYEFRPLGEAVLAINPVDSDYAGTDLVTGFNTFKLPPLTQEQVGQIMSIAVLALDGYGKGAFVATATTADLPLAQPPSIESVKITPVSEPILTGTVLNGTYVFKPAITGNTDIADASTYVWEGNTATPAEVISESGVVPAYTVQQSDVGSVIKLTVNALDVGGRVGNSLSDDIETFKPVPSASELKITSTNPVYMPSYRATLTASYTFNSGIAGDTVDKSTYGFWVDGTLVEPQSKTYAFTANDLGKTISFKVTPINSFDVEGETVTENYSLDTTPPRIENLSINMGTVIYTPFFYGMLVTDYDYIPGISTDAAENEDDNTRFIWSGGAKTENNSVYIFGPDDIGRVLTFSVTPKDMSGQSGTPVNATFEMPRPPAIRNLEINTNVINNSTPYQVILSGKYEYIPSTTDKSKDNSTYNWTGMTSPVSGEITDGVASGIVRPVALVAEDAGKLITLEVLPRDGNLWLGQAVEATTRAPTQLMPPKITNLRLENTNTSRVDQFYINDTIVAKYDFAGSSVNNVDASSYTWTATSGNKTGVVNGVLEFVIQPSDAGSIIRLDMEAKDGLGNLGNKANASTSSVISPPSVINLKILEDTLVTSPWNVRLKGSYEFVPGKSSNPVNDSLYSWSGISNAITNQSTTGAGTITIPAITINKADAGKVVTLSVTPRDLAKNVGEIKSTTYSLPQAVIKAPQINNLQIVNLTRAGNIYLANHVLGATYDFINGSESTQDASPFTWIAKSGVTNGVVGINPLRYTIKAEDVGQVIELNMLAKDAAQISGNTATAKTTNMVSKVPSITSVNIGFVSTGSPTITGTYQYVAGTSANTADRSLFRWVVANDAPVAFTAVARPGYVDNTQAYTVKQADVGKLITLEVLPTDGSGLQGTSVMSNSVFYKALVVTDVKILGDAVESKSLSLQTNFSYSNNTVNKSQASWSKDGVFDKVTGLTDAYPLVKNDVGKTISVSVTAKDGNDILGNTLTDSKGPVLVAFVPPRIEKLAIFYHNSPTLIFPDHKLGGTYDFYAGTIPGDKSTYEWLSGTTLRDSGDVLAARYVPPYFVKVEDVGQVITLRVTAKDGNLNPGNTLEDKTVVVFKRAFVDNVKISYNSGAGNLLVGHTLGGSYGTFIEGSIVGDKSKYAWYSNSTLRSSGDVSPGRFVPAYKITDLDLGTVMTLKITARDGGLNEGNTASDSTNMVVKPPSVSPLSIDGRIDIGYVLTAKYKYMPSVSPNNADGSLYRWIFDNIVDNNWKQVDQTESQLSRKLTEADMGKTIRFELQARDQYGITGNTISMDLKPPALTGLYFSTTTYNVGTVLQPNFTFVRGSRGFDVAFPQTQPGFGVIYKFDNISQAGLDWQVSSVSGTIKNSPTLSVNDVGKVITFSAYPYDTNYDRGGVKSISTSKVTNPPTPTFGDGKDYWLLDVQGPGQFINITSGSAFANLGWPSYSIATKIDYEWVVGSTQLAKGTLIRNNTTSYALGSNVSVSRYRGQSVCIYLTGYTSTGVPGPRQQAWCRVVP